MYNMSYFDTWKVYEIQNIIFEYDPHVEIFEMHMNAWCHLKAYFVPFQVV